MVRSRIPARTVLAHALTLVSHARRYQQMSRVPSTPWFVILPGTYPCLMLPLVLMSNVSKLIIIEIGNHYMYKQFLFTADVILVVDVCISVICSAQCIYYTVIVYCTTIPYGQTRKIEKKIWLK